MGYIYTNIKTIAFLFYYEMPKDVLKDPREWSTLGTASGDLLTRIIYSKYITNPRFKNI